MNKTPNSTNSGERRDRSNYIKMGVGGWGGFHPMRNGKVKDSTAAAAGSLQSCPTL